MFETLVQIYKLSDPRLGRLEAYIGASTCPEKRLIEHVNDLPTYPKNKKSVWLKELKKEGLIPVLTILAIAKHKDAAIVEHQIIKQEIKIRGKFLTNKLVHLKKRKQSYAGRRPFNESQTETPRLQSVLVQKYHASTIDSI